MFFMRLHWRSFYRLLFQSVTSDPVKLYSLRKNPAMMGTKRVMYDDMGLEISTAFPHWLRPPGPTTSTCFHASALSDLSKAAVKAFSVSNGSVMYINVQNSVQSLLPE